MRFCPSWRHVIVGVAAAGMISARCGGGDRPAPHTGNRIEGGSLTVATFAPTSLDPHFSSFVQDVSLERMLWRGLYGLDPSGTPRPMMAREPADISEDGRIYTVRLREGLRWSDGNDLTAADFVAGILRACNPENAAPFESLLSNLTGCDEHFTAGVYNSGLEDRIGVRTLDDLTVEFQLESPQ